MNTHISISSKLADLSLALQGLHHRLLTRQADQVGFRGGPLQLFDLATKDSSFGWLKPLRDKIVHLDERRADDEPLTVADARLIAEDFETLLSAETGEFRKKVNATFQMDQDAIWAMALARKSLEAIDQLH